MDDITTIRSRFDTLRAQSEEKKDTTRSLVEELADDIRELRKRGISFKDILTAIKGENTDLKLTESTLKRYVYESSPKKKTRKKKTEQQTEQKTEQHSEQHSEQVTEKKKEEKKEVKTKKDTQNAEKKFATIDDDEA